MKLLSNGIRLTTPQNTDFYTKLLMEKSSNRINKNILREINPSYEEVHTKRIKKANKWLATLPNYKDIQCNAKGKEKTIINPGNGKTIKFDGFCQKTNTVYEFHGDYWHGNPRKYDPEHVNKSNKQQFGDLYDNTLEREAIIVSLGYNLVTIWEDEFDALSR